MRRAAVDGRAAAAVDGFGVGALMGRAIMVQGTASSAGKSLLATALCAHAARAGVAVAPFKAQSMSNNARVVDGGEIGAAQALQDPCWSRATPVRWARTPAQLAGARLIVLPGAKHVAASMDWLRETGLDVAIATAARGGTPVLGICGGMQLLGDRITDPHGIDGTRHGLGLLPLCTTYAADKLTAHGRWTFARLGGPWRPWSQATVDGYEIRHGGTTATADVIAAGRGFVNGNVLGVSVHGLLEDARLVRALLDVELTPLTETFDLLADTVADRLDPTVIDDLCTAGRPSATCPPSAAPADDSERRHR